MKIKTTLALGATLSVGLLLSACSQQSTGGGITSQQVQNEPAAEVAQPSDTAQMNKSGQGHTHPANECTNSITHTHPNGATAHKHRYSCNPNRRVTSRVEQKPMNRNTHAHPANRCTRSISHTHPSGARSHNHRYSCQPKYKKRYMAPKPRYTGNGHRHPANRCTRSIMHSHPNGRRSHSHKYSCQGNVRPTGNGHRHPANRCTRSIMHSHPNGRRNHKHAYSCKGTGMRAYKGDYVAVNTGATYSVNQLRSVANRVLNYKQIGAARTVANKGANSHKHPANRCTRSISHSHPNGKRTHKHSYSCKSNTRREGYDRNSHVHPGNSMTNSVRHTHPNGARKHSHKYGR